VNRRCFSVKELSEEEEGEAINEQDNLSLDDIEQYKQGDYIDNEDVHEDNHDLEGAKLDVALDGTNPDQSIDKTLTE
jgi:hypothetical protein